MAKDRDSRERELACKVRRGDPVPRGTTERQRYIVQAIDAVLDHCSAVVRGEVIGPTAVTAGSTSSLARLRPGLVAELMAIVRAFDHVDVDDRVKAARGHVGAA